jgi:uncharacterized protein (TIGR03437 family)
VSCAICRSAASIASVNMSDMRLAILFAIPCLAGAQLVGPTAIPNAVIPVVFLDGYQLGCTGDSSFLANFAEADQVLQASNLVTVYFDNCSVPTGPSIETLGNAFGQFLASLRYVNGTTVPKVDVVAHSLGGLIVRAYLSGMQNPVSATARTFSPPTANIVRKAVFLATPHFGTAVASYFGVDAQTDELQLGSRFLFDLNTWNQGIDGLSTVEPLAIAGNGGTGFETDLLGTTLAGFDDGVVELTSSSIGFAIAGRTRVVPDCHTDDTVLVSHGLCAQSTPALNNITDTSNVVGQIITSFINGTDAWMSLGQAIESIGAASSNGGLILEAQDLNGNEQTISSATAGVNPLGVNTAAFKEALPVNAALALQVNLVGSTMLSSTVTLAAGTTTPAVVKPGPVITGIVPAGIAQHPRDVAPGAYVTVYGANMASTTAQATQPYPPQLADVQVLVNGTPAPIQYVDAGQINFIFPSIASGVAQLQVKNASGSQTVNVTVVPAVPSIFTFNGQAVGPAAAENAITYTVINADTPLQDGQYVALYMTGLGDPPGATTVTVGGQNCPVQYAGVVGSYAGLDQVNCQIPGGVHGAAVPVIVTTNGRPSNTAQLNIQ